MTEDDARAWIASHVSRETYDAFESYAALVKKWQRAINLVSRGTLEQLFLRHIADSLQVFLNRPTNSGHWLDIGSGAGFPGMICAIAAKDHAPNLTFSFIESDQRKASFLREVSRQTETKTNILPVRIESAPPQHADVVSARALAPLAQLCDLAHPHLAPGGTALFPKGRNHAVEQQDTDRVWKMHREIIPSELDPESVIYKIGELARV